MARLFLRIILWSIAFVALLCLLLIACFQIPSIRLYALSELTLAIESQTNWRIEVDDVTGYLPFHIHLDHLKIKKSGELFFEAEHIDATLSPISLFRGRLELHRLDVIGASTMSQGGSFEEPVLPLFPFAIHSFTLRKLSIVPEIIFRGSVDFDPDLSYISLDLNLMQSGFDSSHFSATLRKESTEYALQIYGRESAHGIVAKQFGISSPIPLNFNAEAVFPIDATDPTELLARGKFVIESTYFHKPLLLESQFSLTRFSYLHLHHLALNWTDHIQASGSLTLNPDLTFSQGRFEILPVELKNLDLPIEIDGSFFGAVTLSGSLAVPAFSFDFDCTGVTIDEHLFNNLTLQGEGKVYGDGIEGTSTVSGEWKEIPFHFETDLDYQKWATLELSQILLETPEANFKGHLYIDHEQHLEGDLSGKIANLTPFFQNYAGSVEGQLSINTHQKDPYHFKLQGSQLSSPDGKIESLWIKGELGSDLKKPGGMVSVSAVNATYQQWKIEEFTARTTVDPTKTSWPFHIEATQSEPASINLISNGYWYLGDRIAKMYLHRLEGAFESLPIKLNQPVVTFWDKEALVLTSLDISFGEGRLNSQGSYRKDAIGLNLHGHKIPLSLISSYLYPELKMKGDLTVNLSLYGHPDAIEGSIDIGLSRGAILEDITKKLPPLKGNWHANLHPTYVDVNGYLRGFTTKPIILSGSCPIQLSVSQNPISFPQEKPLDLHLKAEGEIAPFLELFVTDTTSVTGIADVNVDISGTWETPTVDGLVHVKEGSIESLLTGSVINNIEGTIRGKGKELILESIQGTDGEGGIATVTGEAQLDIEQSFPFDLNIGIDRAYLVQLDYARAIASGNLKVQGNLKGAQLTGDLRVDHATLTIPEELPAQMRTVEATYINQSKNPDKKSPEPEQKIEWPLDIQVNVTAEKDAFVRGRDLSSEWKGDLVVSGTPNKPLINGTMRLLTGRYNFNGRNFQSRRGTVTFAGDPAKKTTIYVMAEQDIDDLKVQAVLKGPISDPTLAFHSNPPLSEKEILSWILFGRGTQDITPYQGDQLRQTYFTLSAGRNRGDVLSEIRTRFGIDRVDISSSETNEANEVSVRVGKYISRGIYVSLGRNITTEANQVAIEANVARHIKAQAEAGDNAEGTFSIKWENSY